MKNKMAFLVSLALNHAVRAWQRGADQSEVAFQKLFDDGMAILCTAKASSLKNYVRARKYLSRNMRRRYGYCNRVTA